MKIYPACFAQKFFEIIIQEYTVTNCRNLAMISLKDILVKFSLEKIKKGKINKKNP